MEKICELPCVQDVECLCCRIQRMHSESMQKRRKLHRHGQWFQLFVCCGIHWPTWSMVSIVRVLRDTLVKIVELVCIIASINSKNGGSCTDLVNHCLWMPNIFDTNACCERWYRKATELVRPCEEHERRAHSEKNARCDT